mgnify:FL=1
MPECIFLDDSGIVAFIRSFWLGWYRSEGMPGLQLVHVVRHLGPAVDKGGTKASGPATNFRASLQSFEPG